MKKFLTLILLILFLLLPLISLALELDYPRRALELDYPRIGDIEIALGMDLNKLIAWFYYFIISIAGIAAFVMLIWGGIEWMTSAGNPTKIGEAKERINSAFLGLIIILSSYLILQVINPDLIMLRLPALQ